MSQHRTQLRRITTATVAAAACLAATGAAAAQIGYNEVMRFGMRDLVQSAKHPTTKYPLEVPGVQPAAYMAGSTSGVAAGTLTWIWYPSQLNARLEYRVVTGHMIAVRPSSATPLSDYSKTHSGQASPGVPVYIPRFSILPAKQRPPQKPKPAFGDGFDPDFGKTPLLTYNTVHTPLVQPVHADQALLWTITYSIKVAVKSKEVVLAYEWQGGEHYTKPRSQSLPSGWSESMFAPVHWGFAAPGPGRAITRFDPSKILPGTNLNIYSSPMGGYFEDQATIAMHSDWGEAREPALSTFVYPSYNVGSGLADLATKAGAFGWDVFTDPANSGMRALPLLNVRTAPVGVPTPFLSRVLEVDLADPVLAMLWGNPLADGRISNAGVWLPAARIKVPALGATALGLWIGLEFGIVDPTTNLVPQTTQAYWFYIGK